MHSISSSAFGRVLRPWALPLAVVLVGAAGFAPAGPARAEVDWRGGNHLEYALEREGGREILEDWFDLEWSSGDLAAAIRYEIFQPHELSPDSVRQGLSFKSLSYSGRIVSITAGNFYALWGRGLALRAYEDRGVRRDSNLEGIRVDLAEGPADLSFLSGRALDQNGKRPDLLPGLDANVEPRGFLRRGRS